MENFYDYFIDLNKKNLPQQNGIFVHDHSNIIDLNTENSFNPRNTSKRDTPSISINGIPFFKKPASKTSSVMQIASTNMYNAIGIATPPIHLFTDPELHNNNLFLISQDLHSIKDFVFELAKQVVCKKEIISFRLKSDKKWDILYLPELQEIFLQYMTPECLDQLKGLFLIDELRTELDRNEGNYFFYKSPESDKFEGVIAIDSELTEISRHDTSEERYFKDFLTSNYTTITPINTFDTPTCHKIRIANIRNAIQDQVISPRNIKLIEDTLKYAFPKAIKEAGGLHPIFKPYQEYLYNNVSRLWEYNRQELCNDICL